MNRRAELLFRGSDVEATSFGSRSRHESKLVSAFNGTGAAHGRLDIVKAGGGHIHESFLHELVPVFGRVKAQSGAVRGKGCHALALSQLEHLRLVVAQGT